MDRPELTTNLNCPRFHLVGPRCEEIFQLEFAISSLDDFFQRTETK